MAGGGGGGELLPPPVAPRLGIYIELDAWPQQIELFSGKIVIVWPLVDRGGGGAAPANGFLPYYMYWFVCV